MYADAPLCAGQVAACTLCHASLSPPSWNPFGTQIGQTLAENEPFDQALPDALLAIEGEDSDQDGVSNLDELLGGSLPGDPSSVRKPSAVLDGGVSTPAADAGSENRGAGNPEYQVGKYDPSFAFKRITTLYCGRSPSFSQREAFRAAEGDPAATRKTLHETLEQCLQSDYWQKTALPRLADRKIRPQGSLGPDSKIMFGNQKLSIADYYYDYRLWRWTMTENRDMRELLTADYFVLEGPDGKLVTTYETQRSTGLGGGQPLPRERRAGMITTQWFLVINTMFSALPRTTAAQAYRAYLGADISAGEGLIPIPNEPVDIDNKGVAEARCAGCHSTLDPLAYAFMKYEGIGFSGLGGSISQGAVRSGASASGSAPSAAGGIYPSGTTPAAGATPPGIYPSGTTPGVSGVTGRPSSSGFDYGSSLGGYSENRGPRRIPGWDDEKQQPYVLGKPVETLIEWAKVASQSDEFKRTMTETFYVHAFGREADASEQAEFIQLWRSLPEDGYSANRLLHRLIDTKTFGAP